MLLLSVHKLVALAAVVIIAVIFYQANKAIKLPAQELIILVITSLLILVTFISGGLLSTEKEMPTWILGLHRIAPFLALLSSSATVFLAIGRQR